MNSDVVFVEGVDGYPAFPYDPGVRYPELRTFDQEVYDSGNAVYSSVRSLLAGLKLDVRNFGRAEWNPLGALVGAGGVVLLKPNWVRDYNVVKGAGAECLLTHTSILRPLIDYAAKALAYRGTIVIADAPLQNCDFTKLRSTVRIDELLDHLRPLYPDVVFIVEDWRLTVTDRQRFIGLGAGKRLNQGDESRCEVVDLGEQSLLCDLDDYASQFRVTCYDPQLMLRHHTNGHHKYLVSKRVFEADLVINVPVLKTHIKAGITAALKNLVGINGHKEYLPHHCKGGYERGGDNFYSGSAVKASWEELDEWYWRDPNRFPRLVRALIGKTLHVGWGVVGRLSSDGITGGGWSGNDTLWRTIIDLNHVLYFYDFKNKSLQEEPVRSVITVVDAVVAGEGEGPLSPLPKKAGLIYGGFNPATVDLFGLKTIGYNISRIKSVSQALFDVRSRFNIERRGSAQFVQATNGVTQDCDLASVKCHYFKLPKYWARCGVPRHYE